MFFPARCVMGPFKPTFFKRDAHLTVWLAGLPAPPLGRVGSWKQISIVEATHLPSRAGFKRVHTARAGHRENLVHLGAAFFAALFLSIFKYNLFRRGVFRRALFFEKVDKATFSRKLHERFASISFEIVGKSFVRSVISEVHAPGNDGSKFIPPPEGGETFCGRAFLQAGGPVFTPLFFKFFINIPGVFPFFSPFPLKLPPDSSIILRTCRAPGLRAALPCSPATLPGRSE